MSNPEEKDQGVAWVVGSGLFGAVVLTIVYLRFRTGFPVPTLEAHANLGNALAPAVAFLTLLAVISALWSVQVQRTELALQRKELQSTREEMMEQRKQFERTAVAQEDLAKAQRLLAEGQRIANDIQLNNAPRLLAAEHAQRMTNVATLMAATSNLVATIEAARDPISGSSPLEEKLMKEIQSLVAQRDSEAKTLFELEETLGEMEADDDTGAWRSHATQHRKWRAERTAKDGSDA